jgi:hypothetical protein
VLLPIHTCYRSAPVSEPRPRDGAATARSGLPPRPPQPSATTTRGLFLSRDRQGAVPALLRPSFRATPVSEPRPRDGAATARSGLPPRPPQPSATTTRGLFLSRDRQGAVPALLRPSFRATPVSEPRPLGSGCVACLSGDRLARGGHRGPLISEHDHQALFRGRHQGVRRGRRRCVPALPLRRQSASLS